MNVSHGEDPWHDHTGPYQRACVGEPLDRVRAYVFSPERINNFGRCSGGESQSGCFGVSVPKTAGFGNPPSAGIPSGRGGGVTSIPSEEASAGRLKARHGRRPRPEQKERSDCALCREGATTRGFRSTRQLVGVVSA